MRAASRCVLLDANAALRYLLEDNVAQADLVAEAIEGADGAEITAEVVAECVYVLGGVYEVPRALVAESLVTLLGEVACRRKEAVNAALSLYAATKLDFVDCLLAAEHDTGGREVLTFDKRLASLLARLDDAQA